MKLSVPEGSLYCNPMAYRIFQLLGIVLAAHLSRPLSAQNPRDFLDRFCVDCHGDLEPEAGLDVTALSWDAPGLDDLERWREARNRVARGEMPPAGETFPSPAERKAFAATVDALLARAAEKDPAEPGRVTLRRLSRFEYDRTTRDRLGLVTEKSAAFPADNLGYGFDNMGDAMSFSLLHMETYLDAAEDLARRAISLEDPKHPPVRRIEGEDMSSKLEDAVGQGNVARLYSRGTVFASILLPRDGDYIITVRAFGDQAGEDPVRMALSLDRDRLQVWDVPEIRRRPGERVAHVRLPAGRHRLAVTFLNDFYEPDAEDPSQRDRNLYVDWVEVKGPTDPIPLPAAHRRIFAPDRPKLPTRQRARRILPPLILDLWRRPARIGEVRRFTRFLVRETDKGRSFRQAMREVLTALLVSPHFLFRAEPGGKGRTHKTLPVDDYALANRLSYFLWSSPPDAALLERARKRQLGRGDVLLAEARRMLRDARSEALARGFAGQWLEIRNLEDATPDPKFFPRFDDALRRSMAREVELFFRFILKERRPLRDLLMSRTTFLNERLARHYGVKGIEGSRFQPHVWSDDRRRGLLGKAAILTLTSHASRTSPVKRGKWILENLLDAPPPPPPPGVVSRLDESQVTDTASLRKRLEAHRAQPECASCHERMDGLGFALEHFDAVGRWRDRDGKNAIDARGELPGGREVDGAAELDAVLTEHDGLLRSLLHKLFLYGVGRKAGRADRVRLAAAAGRLPGLDTTLEDAVLAIVGLDAFRFRTTAP